MFINLKRWCSGEPSNGAMASNPQACAVITNSCGLKDKSCAESFNGYVCEAV